MKVENIIPSDYKMVGFYTPAKKIDLGDSYLIFVSGVQAPLGEDNKIISEDIGTQTKLVFEEINKLLNEAGASLDDVIKAVIYITDMKDFSIVSSIRAKYFEKSKPVSTLIECNRMVKDGAKIEIEVTAIKEK